MRGEDQVDLQSMCEEYQRQPSDVLFDQILDKVNGFIEAKIRQYGIKDWRGPYKNRRTGNIHKEGCEFKFRDAEDARQEARIGAFLALSEYAVGYIGEKGRPMTFANYVLTRIEQRLLNFQREEREGAFIGGRYKIVKMPRIRYEVNEDGEEKGIYDPPVQETGYDVILYKEDTERLLSCLSPSERELLEDYMDCDFIFSEVARRRGLQPYQVSRTIKRIQKKLQERYVFLNSLPDERKEPEVKISTPKSRDVLITFPTTMLAQLDTIAEQTLDKRARLVRVAVKEYIDRHLGSERQQQAA